MTLFCRTGSDASAEKLFLAHLLICDNTSDYEKPIDRRYQEYITPRVCNCLHNLYAVLRRQNFTSRDMVQKVMLANSAK